MASLRNAYKTQRVHKERHQPMMREHLGPMEKKKDYIKRAKDQSEKRGKLKNLHKKALSKNPDEFHFHMINSELKNGVHVEQVKDVEISIGDVHKDLIYITHRRSVERKKIEKLKAQLHFLDSDELLDSKKNKHILFVDSKEEAEEADPAELLDTHPSLLNRPFNRLKKSQLSQLELKVENRKILNIKQLASEKKKAYRELRNRIEREEKLRILQEKLEVNKKLMDQKKKKEPKPKLVKKGDRNGAPVYKYKKERKK